MLQLLVLKVQGVKEFSLEGTLSDVAFYLGEPVRGLQHPTSHAYTFSQQ